MSDRHPGDRATVKAFAKLPAAQRELKLRRMPLEIRYELVERWSLSAHHGQNEPAGDWRVWLIRAGRGFGKTRAGAEWVSEVARRHAQARIALVGGTAEDVRRVMVEGNSGLIAVARDDERVRWVADRGEVRFPSGAVAFVYSAAAPEALRGPEHHAAWCDELGKWRDGSAAGVAMDRRGRCAARRGARGVSRVDRRRRRGRAAARGERAGGDGRRPAARHDDDHGAAAGNHRAVAARHADHRKDLT